MRIRPILPFLLFLLFNIISNLPIRMPSFAQISLKESYHMFFYEFEEPENAKDIYLFFIFDIEEYYYLYFPDVNITNEYGETISLKKNRTNNYLTYKITNLRKQKFTFSIYCSFPLNMIFLDNSKEININLEDLFSLDLNLKITNGQLLPLVFNLDSQMDNFYLWFLILIQPKIGHTYH